MIYDVIESIVNKKGALKSIDAKNVKNLVDINQGFCRSLDKVEQKNFIAFSTNSSETDSVGKVNLIKIGDWDAEYVTIKAHETQIEFVRLSGDGKYLATASEKGTVIRIFSSNTLQDDKSRDKPYKEFRRGTTSKIIKDINFGFDNLYVVVCSSSTTVHFFCMDESKIEKESDDTDKSIFKISGVLKSFYTIAHNCIDKAKKSIFKIQIPEG